MIAVVETGGKQYMARVGEVIISEKITANVGDVIELGKVLLTDSGDAEAEKAVVKAEVLEHKKTDKVIVFKKKRRHNYRRKKGHRQQVTVVRVKEIIC